MEDTLLMKVLLAFIAGGIWVALSSTIADKYGPKLGGLLSGFPAPAAITFFFIAYTQSIDKAVAATTVFPLAYSFAGFLLVAYAILARRNLTVAITGAVAVWLVASSLLLAVKPSNFTLSLVIYVILLVINYSLIRKATRSLNPYRHTVRFTLSQTISRATLGGLIIAGAVLASYVGGPQYGGIFAAFPAVFVSTLIIMYRAQGAAFSAAMVLPMFLSGMLSVVGYATAVRYLYPPYGLFWGTIGAVTAASALVYITHRYAPKRSG